MELEMQKLTIRHYSEDPKEERRITLAPHNITVVAAEIEDVTINGASRRVVSVLFMDGGSLDLVVDHQDLQLLETAIGSFCFG
jgi:hypothetical protein